VPTIYFQQAAHSQQVGEYAQCFAEWLEAALVVSAAVAVAAVAVVVAVAAVVVVMVVVVVVVVVAVVVETEENKLED
jgi:FtsH-binding integral membrane protein